MTPAEKPRAPAKKRGLVLFEKKANKLPIPVAKPANNVSPKAKTKSFMVPILIEKKELYKYSAAL
jgi:hypothetical protein